MSLARVLPIVRATSAYRTRAELFPVLVRTLRRVLPVDHIGIAVVSLDVPGTFDFYTDGTFQPESTQLAHYGGAAEALRTRARLPAQLVRPEDLVKFPVHLALWKRLGVQVGCAIPMYAQGRLIGSLGCMAIDPRAHDRLDLELIAALGTVAAVAVDRCLAFERLEQSRDSALEVQASLREALDVDGGFGVGLVGASAAFASLRQQIEVVAPTDATVLLTGESGTGKDVVARAIHAASARRDGPFIAVNCAALPTTLAESELFGHEEGAFTGAARARTGRFELANGGTVFLDELGELSLDVQAKLLRVLQERVIERVGSGTTLPLDVRIIAATNRDLQASVADRSFRSDLYYRLSVFPIALSPLRDRRGDIPALVAALIEDSAARLRVAPRRVTDDAMRRLVEHDWPGNVRELANAIERAMIMSAGEVLDVDHVLPAPEPAASLDPGGASLRAAYLAVLEATSWVIEGPSGAAARVGLHPNTLRARLKRLGLERPR